MSPETRLFLDDTWVADSAFVERVWHSPRKLTEPVLAADEVSLGVSPVLYGSVLFREERFHLWYPAWSRQPRPYACYAVSEDGVRWEKPDLGFFRDAPAYARNAFLRSAHPDGLIDDLTVVDDPDDTDWPLKMLYYDSRDHHRDGGIFAARSRDGIKWEPIGKDKVLDFGDRFNALPTRWNGRFVVFGRAKVRPAVRGRAVWRSESEDLLHWSEPELVLARDLEDPPDREIYSLVPFPYGGLILGGIERMDVSPDRLDTELAWSRDGGRTWRRSRPRGTFLPRGLPGAFDDTWAVLSASVPILRGNDLWFYYSGRRVGHGVPFPLNRGGIGLALLRLDGFVSVRAGQREGWLLTPPFVWEGGDLRVNADTRRDLESHPAYAHGQLTVEVLDAESRLIEGWSRLESVPYTGNSAGQPGARAVIRWKEGRSLDALAGRTIRLRFVLRDAHLYAF